MRGAATLALLGCLIGAAAPADARPASARQGGFEIGGAAFVGILEENGRKRTSAGPLFHVAYRGAISSALQLGLTGRFGVGSSDAGSGATGSLAFEARIAAGEDVVPFALLGFGVLFQSEVEDNLGRLAPEPRPALPVGAGVELRIGEASMLGVALRYTAVLSHLDSTVGPIDLALYLVFL
jgi:hypothetical protein